MDKPAIRIFNDSLARCLSNDRFFRRFYELFLASSQEVRDKFRNTDFAKQNRMLRASFYSTEVEAAWRFMMGAGIVFLKNRYDHPIANPQTAN